MWSLLSPSFKEAAIWFALGSALGLFLCMTLFVLAAATPGLGGASGLARSIGKSLDGMLTTDSRQNNLSPPLIRSSRRSFDHL